MKNSTHHPGMSLNFHKRNNSQIENPMDSAMQADSQRERTNQLKNYLVNKKTIEYKVDRLHQNDGFARLMH